MLQITIWSIPPLLATLVCAGTFVRLREKNKVPGMNQMLALLAAVMIWSAMDFLSSLLTDFDMKLLMVKLSYIGVVIVPAAWFAFAFSYARKQLHLPPQLLAGILIIPAITVILALTNDMHRLIWSNATLVDVNGFTGLVFTAGDWSYLHAAYSYLLVIVGTTILAWTINQTTGELKPVLAVIFTPLVVIATNLFYLSPSNESPWIDITTLGLAAAAIILNGGVLRFGMLDALPVLRERFVELLSDGVVVVNHEGMIIDVNTSALKMFATKRTEVSNQPISQFVTTVGLENLLGPRDNNLEITMGDQAYDISASSLDGDNPQADVGLVFRDVTLRRKTERDLRMAQEELVRLAHTDYLTGLHNRRFFMQRLEEEIERVRRHGSKLSVLLFDLDFFKQVNDTCGHDVGDVVLKKVAEATTTIKRITDVSARVGGEEFALLLPETDQKGAVHLAQRLRKWVALIQPKELEHTGLKITVSVGVATVDSTSKDVENVLFLADEALYEAKHSGRNAVRCALSTGAPVPSSPDS